MPIFQKLVRPVKNNLKTYYQKRNTILISRKTGGVGDILMSRMIFEDFKKLMPESRIAYSLPIAYHELVRNHPYIDEVLDCRYVNELEYTISYDITRACGNYETRIAPKSDKHRSDIWANHCGIQLTEHNMHLTLNKENIEFGKNILETHRESDKPLILLCPISAMVTKNLDKNQMNGIVSELEQEDCTVVGLHSRCIEELIVPTIHSLTLSNWLGVINAADYVISVDSGPFHACGGLDKPCVGIFSWADGKTYGKWYKRWLLVQRHRDNGNWSCGPCYGWPTCPKSNAPRKPCITDITPSEIVKTAKNMMALWPKG